MKYPCTRKTSPKKKETTNIYRKALQELQGETTKYLPYC